VSGEGVHIIHNPVRSWGTHNLPPSFSQELSQYAYFVLNTSSDEYYSTWLMRNALFYYLLETL